MDMDALETLELVRSLVLHVLILEDDFVKDGILRSILDSGVDGKGALFVCSHERKWKVDFVSNK